MIDLGKKDDYSTEIPATKKPQIHYPSFFISNVDLGIDEDDVGKIFTATIKIKIMRAGKNINAEKDKTKIREDYNFDVLAIEFDKDKITKPSYIKTNE